jgi:glycosyltransferase involved in cell wall biosynthesis
MKVSIITITYNSAKTLSTTLESVKSQDYPDIEHIIVDGLSTDDTMQIVGQFPHVSKVVSEKDQGLYDALNKGILMATGDIVGLLHSDDFLASNTTISQIVEAFNNNDTESVIADIAFVRPSDLKRVVRHYSSKHWNPSKFVKGFMPPHPSFYCKREVYEQYGLYKTDYKIAADYELLIRFFWKHKVSYLIMPFTVAYMRTGGASNASLKNRLLLNQETVRACRENGLKTNLVKISMKYPIKLLEYLSPLFRKH